MEAGPTTAPQAPQEGPRLFLSVLPTAQSSCGCAKGKLQLSKTKTPKEELPWRLGKTDGSPPPPQAPWAEARGWEAQRVTILYWRGSLSSGETSGAGVHGTTRGRITGSWPQSSLGEASGWERCLYLPNFCEKIFSKVTSPRSSRYFCMTLRMLQAKEYSEQGPQRPWPEVWIKALIFYNECINTHTHPPHTHTYT